LVDRREEYREGNTAAKGKQDKDTKGNGEDLKVLTSKLLSSLLQQGNS